MILIDLNQVVISNLMQQINIMKSEQIEPGFLRHLILNSIRSFKTKFGDKYGDLVICDDAGDYWRKWAFSYYKENRKKNRQDSIYDWKYIFDTLHEVKVEIAYHFPYKYMSIRHCEADDIIAVLAQRFHTEEPILIVSSDKDFVQLFKYPNIYQYSPIQKKMVEEADPDKYLLTKIIKGDPSDGIPNILSEDDTFVVPGKRQRKISKHLLENFDINKLGYDSYLNWERNRCLIDFDCIPPMFRERILQEFEEPIVGSYEKAYSYLIDNNLRALQTVYGEF